MTTTAVAAVATIVVGIAGCLWLLTRGHRSERMTAYVILSLIACLSLVFYSIGKGGMAALDAALIMGVFAPMGTLVVAGRGRTPVPATAPTPPLGSTPAPGGGTE